MSQFITVLSNFYAVPYGKDGVRIITMISCPTPVKVKWTNNQSLGSHCCQVINARGYMMK